MGTWQVLPVSGLLLLAASVGCGAEDATAVETDGGSTIPHDDSRASDERDTANGYELESDTDAIATADGEDDSAPSLSLDATTRETAATDQCVPKDWYTEESGCEANEICLGREGCYPLAGLVAGSCHWWQRTDVVVALRDTDAVYRGVSREWSGVVSALSSETLVLDADESEEPVVLDYHIGSYKLPIKVGEHIRLQWVIVQSFGTAQGFAIWSDADELLAVVDDGEFGSAWAKSYMPGGFEIRTEMAGCPVDADEYSATLRLALRFNAADEEGVVVPPGESATLAVNGEHRFTVVNAQAYRFIYALFSEAVPKISWIVLREP